MHRAPSRKGFKPHRPGVLPALLLGSATLGLPSVHAMGVGLPRTLSALGQPLHLQFPLRLAAGETLTPECVRAEVLAGDQRLPATALQLQLEGESESAVRSVRLQSLGQVDEPLVTVHLSLGCPARFTRQFTAFIDPPGAEPAVATAPPPEPALRNYSPAMRAALATAEARPAALLAQPAAEPAPPALAAAPAAEAASRPARRAPIVPPAALAERPAAERLAQAPAARAPVRPPRAPAKPLARLQLEPAEVVEAAPPASAAAVASPPPPVDPALQERLAKLEQSLQKMQGEGRNTQDQLQALRLQLQQAQQARFQNPLVYGLGALALALAAGCLHLWRGRRSARRRHESAWWDEELPDGPHARTARQPEPAPLSAPIAAPIAAPTAPPVSALAPAPLAPDEASLPWAAQRPEEPTLPLPGLDVQAEMAAASPTPQGAAGAPSVEPLFMSLAEPAPEPEPLHEPVSFQLVDMAPAAAPAPVATRVSVEELIDLEQQIEFFLVLGQDEAAVELLQAQLRAGGEDVAMPYLKLLDIYQRLGRQDAFTALAQRYAQRFGCVAPAWGSGEGDGLEGRPKLLARLQARWRNSAASMVLLQSLLTGHESAREAGLDLTACRELLLLYSVARDLSEHEVRGEEIDLFLPLDPPSSASAGMMATMAWQNTAGHGSARPHALEVDIALDEPEPRKA